ncbi:ribonuclease HI family protein [Candidatus Wolfebacteria bacterium]|nr:ribonuclease HI family protein [Candidatus Wolfebacteria bacterium]
MYTIYTDGGARGNPGPAGAGAVIFDANMRAVVEASEFLGVQTNNWAEYEAVVLGLTKLQELVPEDEHEQTEVTLRLDSQLVERQLIGQYRVKDPELYKQYVKVKNIMNSFPKIIFEHVRREKNKEADALANIAMDEGSL